MVSAIRVRLLMLKPGQVHDAEGADQRERHRDAGDDRSPTGLRRNRKITMTTRATASISSNCTSFTEARMVTVRSVSSVTLHRGGQRSLAAAAAAP